MIAACAAEVAARNAIAKDAIIRSFISLPMLYRRASAPDLT
jgi:hypothetical protein